MPAVPLRATLVDAGPFPPSVSVHLVGSAPDCDLVVPQAAPYHALLETGDTPRVHPLSASADLRMNGQAVAACQAIDPVRDRLTLGAVSIAWPTTARPASLLTIGRAPENDIVLDLPVVSSAHARLVVRPDATYVQDLGSTNGTAVNRPGARVRFARVTDADSVFFGSLKVPVARLLAQPATTQPEAVAFRGDRMVIGRDPECDWPLPHPVLSWHHAELVRAPEGLQVRDLHSRNGTFVNGERLHGTVTLQPGDSVALGSVRLQLTDAGLERRDYHGHVTLEAKGLAVNAGGVRLLEGVSLTVYPSELVALMGPSGAGKTTLLQALGGAIAPSEGQVLINGQDLSQSADLFRRDLGYVPQDDLLHPQLTVAEALRFAARLRTDMRAEEIEREIDRTLAALDIADLRDREIGCPERKVISGGQRKRVNIALELLCGPSVLLLDEPTSGLSSYDAAKVVRLLKRLAEEGRTVVLTIHQPGPEMFRLFDSLAVLARDRNSSRPGVLAYFGPAYPQAIHFFRPDLAGQAEPAPETLLEGLEDPERPSTHWVEQYERSDARRRYVEERAGKPVATPGPPRRSGRSWRWRASQVVPLLQRAGTVRLRDRLQTGILLAQAPLFGLLVILAFGRLPFEVADMAAWPPHVSRLASAHFLLVVAALWFGCNNAAREIVGEAAIVRRERRVGLQLPSYVLSKLLLMAGLGAFQCFALLALVRWGCDLRVPFGEAYLTLVSASLVGAALGLVVSALARTSEAAIALLPVVLLPMIVFGGGIKPLHHMPQAAQQIARAVPSRWAFEANLLAEAQRRPRLAFNPCAPLQREAAKGMRETQQACALQVEAMEREMRRMGQQLRQVEQARSLLTGRPARTVPSPPRLRPRPVPAVRTSVAPVDVADNSFPHGAGRGSLRNSLMVLGAMLGTLLAFLVSVLWFRDPPLRGTPLEREAPVRVE